MNKSSKYLLASFLFPASLLAATISGTVTTGTGPTSSPVSGAMVVLLQQGAGGPVPLDTVFTDSLGQYSFPNITTGTKILTVSAVGYDPSTQFTNIVNPNQNVVLNFNLASTGTGSTGSISGTVSAGGNPVAGALVILSRIGTGGVVVVDSVRTDSLGRYFLDSVTAQSGYIILVQAPGFAPASRPNVIVTAGGNTVENFNLTPTALRSGLPSSGRAILCLCKNGRIDLGRPIQGGSVEVYNLQGTLRCRVPVKPGMTQVDLPGEISQPSAAYLLRIR